jgi:uncharacterized protein (DUF111 family)
VIATDLDDLQPEYIQPLRDAVFDAGAVDCVVWTTQGKKGRVSIRVEALAPAEAADRVTQALFMHSTTTGVRRWPATRSTLERRQVEVDLEGDVRIRIKVWEGPFGRRLKPEYADVIAAASRLGRPALEVAHEAERRADKLLHDGEQP